jgi:hypothetical protein
MRLATTLLLAAVLSTGAHAEGSDGSTGFDIDGNPFVKDASAPSSEGGEAPQAGGALIFDNQAAFLAAAGPVATETFEDEPSTALCDGLGLAVLAVDDFLSTSNVVAMKLLREPCFGNHNTTPGGLKYLGADTELGAVSAEVMFVFNQPISALGLFLIDLDLAVLEVTINGVSYPVPPNGDGGESYFGIVGALPFTAATFRIVTGTDSHYSFDDVAYALAGPVSVESRSWGRAKADWRD